MVYRKGSSFGLTHHPIRTCYLGMKSRCSNPKNNRYKNYGARGIKVCEEWANDFMAFYNWSVDNGWAKGLSIDRIDSNGNYEPKNCRWVTEKVQQRNRSNNVIINHEGVSMTLIEWAEKTGISFSTLQQRYYIHKWPVEMLFIKPSFSNRCPRGLKVKK